MIKGIIALGLLISTHAFADSDFIGTQDHPVPLTATGTVAPELEQVTLYFYQDHSYVISQNNEQLYVGQFTDNKTNLSFSDRAAFANKISNTQSDKRSTCLQMIFYKPTQLMFKTGIFCHR